VVKLDSGKVEVISVKRAEAKLHAKEESDAGISALDWGDTIKRD